MLIGAVFAPVTSAPLVILIYAVLILMIASGLATVVLREARFAIGAFAATMILVAILYLAIAPLLLFAVQLLIFTVVSTLILLALLRNTGGFAGASVGPFSREWIVGASLGAALLALSAVILAAGHWSSAMTLQGRAYYGQSLLSSMAGEYVVSLAVVVILLASAALGAGLLLTAPRLPFAKGGGRVPAPGSRPPARGRRDR